MGRTHQEQTVLAKQLEDAKTKAIVGAKYRHYKSTDESYEVLGFGFWEATDEICVIYQAQYGERPTFLRPLKSWLESVEWEGKTVPRFTRLS